MLGVHNRAGAGGQQGPDKISTLPCSIQDASNFWANVETLVPRASVSMATTLLLPKSTGHIRIQSTDPFEYPEIQPNYLTDKDGVRSLCCVRARGLENRGGARGLT